MNKRGIWGLIAILTLNITFLSKINVNAATVNIELGIKEDINEDGIVDIIDLSTVAQAYNVTNNSALYNEMYDINDDNIIDIFDLVKISQKLGTVTIKIGYVFDSSYLNVRSGPGTSYKQVGTLYLDDKVEIVGEPNNEWYKIKFNGGHAFVYQGYITEVEPNSNYNHSLDYYVNIQKGRQNLTDIGGVGWINATTEQIKYYMNPDNFVNNDGKYMFMKLTYVDGISLDIANEIIQGRGILNEKGQAFLTGAKKYNVNPVYLMCHARLETGNGTSKLSTGIEVSEVDGKQVEPRVVYNMFGIGADDKDPVRLGAETAYKEGWFTPELAIVEGAKWVSGIYVNNQQYKQNTLYKMRWDITHFGIRGHQYATDIGWANKQAKMMAAYLNKCNGIELEYEIPTFMPTLREIYYNVF